MDFHHGGQDQHACPQNRKPAQHEVKCRFFHRHHIAEENQRELDQRIGRQPVAGSHIDLLQRPLSVKQGGQPPVSQAPQRQGKQNACQIQEDVDSLPVHMQKNKSGKLELHDPAYQSQQQNGVGGSQGASLLMGQVPESVQGVSDAVQGKFQCSQIMAVGFFLF